MNLVSLRGWLGRVPAPAVDVGLAVAVAVAVTIGISVAREPDSRPPDALAYALVLTIAGLVLARRRWPLAVLGASVLMLQIYYILDYPGVSAAVPLAVALYTAAAAGQLRWALVVAAWYATGGIGFAFIDQRPLLPVLNELLRDGALLSALLLFGDAVRSRRALMAEVSERLRRAEEDRAGRHRSCGRPG